MESVKTGDGRIIVPVAEKDQVLLQIPHPGKISVRNNRQCDTGLGLDLLADLLCQLPVTGGNGDHSGRLAVFHQIGLDTEVTLHIGLGTFRPVKVERIEDHLMHTEEFHISEEVSAEINARRAAGGRIIAVGTTSCRVLESASDENGIVHAMSADTGIFIYPGYKFKAVDALITNFHLPESTLLMLVSALYNREKILEAYKIAVEEKYRFFSFGDAMFIE